MHEMKYMYIGEIKIYKWFTKKKNELKTNPKILANSFKYITHDCGTHPIAKPTRPLSKSNQRKLGATALNSPYNNNKTEHSVKAWK